MTDTPSETFAFRCRSCGALEPAGAAGELDRPAACHICGAGVRFDPRTGIKSLEPENWDVLSELHADERRSLIKDRKLDAAQIVEPDEPLAPGERREPQNIDRSAGEDVGGEDEAEKS